MANQSASSVTNIATPVSTEGTVMVSAPTNYNNPAGQGNLISGSLNVTAGTGTTAVVIRCRGGSGTGGATVGPAAGVSHTLAAGASASIAFDFVDGNTAFQSQQQYTITIQQTGGTGAGTVNYGVIGIQPSTSAP